MAESALILTGATMQAASHVGAGVAAYRQGEFESEVFERNARAQEQAAAAEEANFRRDARRRLGRRRAVLGSSGVDIASGSPLESMVDAAMQAEQDALLIRHGGKVAAQGSRFRATAARQRGQSGLVGNLLASPAPLLDKNVLDAGNTLLTEASSYFGG